MSEAFEAAFKEAKERKPNTHVMIDLETFGTGAWSVPISLGAVKFDPLDRHARMESFYVCIDPKSAADVGLKIDVDTVLWWMQPERQEAFKQWFGELKYELPIALDGFAKWLGPESTPVWGNGATFDNTILRNAYKACRRDVPWDFHHDRCFRTFKNLHPGAKKPAYLGTQHNALTDAVQQVQWFHEIVTFGDFEKIV